MRSFNRQFIFNCQVLLNLNKLICEFYIFNPKLVRIPGEMNSFLRELPFSMDGILVRLVLDDFDPFAAVRLLRTVFGNHVELTDVILNETNENLTCAYIGKQA